MDSVSIRGLKFTCIIGTFTTERDNPQEVVVSVDLGLDAKPAGRTGRLELSCDYVATADAIVALMQFRRYRLLETAAEEVAAMLFGCNTSIEQVTLSIAKPSALAMAEAAELRVERSRGGAPRFVPSELGRTATLLETSESILELHRLEPHTSVPPPAPDQLQWVLDGTPAALLRCTLRQPHPR